MNNSLQHTHRPLQSAWAVIVSWVFHPLFIPLYATAFLLYIHPSFFSGFSALAKKQVMLITLLNGVFFPLLTVALLKGLGFISSIYMRTSRDRIIPYIACNIFFFWTYTIFHKQENYPEILSSFWLGIFLASSAALLLNIYMKVSMHTIGAGGLLGLFLYLSFQQDMLMTWPFSAVLLTCGLVGTARLFLKSHNEAEIYVGFITGILSQLIAAYIIL